MSSFSAADYRWLAAALRADLKAADLRLSSEARCQAVESIYRWTERLAADNPKGFDRDRFISNCGLTYTSPPSAARRQTGEPNSHPSMRTDKCQTPKETPA